jgi:tape measure domain-containing protein
MAVEKTTIVVEADTRQAQRALGGLQSALGSLLTIGAVSGLAKQFFDLADASTNLQNKMSLVVQEGQTSNQLFLVMAKSALALGAPLQDVGDLFFRIANNTKDLGLAQTDQLKITETLIKGFQLTGQSMGETKGAIVQLGQAFAVGVLRGDELNSVLESLPMVSDALAAKFGVQRGALKALGEQGKITSKDLKDAILESGAAIDTAWANKIPTVAQSFNKLQTALQVAVGQFDKATGTSEAFSLAIIKIATALVQVINFFEKWGSAIGFVVQAIAFIYVPLRIARAAFALLIGPIEWLIGLFSGIGGAVAGVGRAFAQLVEYITPITAPVTLLGNKIAGLFGILAAGASAIGLGSLISGFKDLFSNDKAEAADKFKKAQDDLNKALGIDGVEAMNKAKEATGGLTAEQVKNAEAIRKANVDRDSDYQKILRDATSELGILKYIGDELTIQQALYSANKGLVRDIKDSNGNIIGQTAAMSKLEEDKLRLITQQNIELKRQQDIRQKLTSVMVPLQGSAAGAETAGQLPNLLPQQAAMTANQTLFSGLEYLRQQDLISEQAYQVAKTNLAVQANASIMEANRKQYENAAMLRIQQTTGTQFGYDTQKQMAADASAFEMKSNTEKNAMAIDAMAQMFTALGAQNKKAFEASKAFNIANAMMNSYMAFTKALATYPFPFGAIMGGAALALGFAQVSAIRSQQYSGRALGGPVMGGQSYMVGENGPEMFTPATTGTITRNGDLNSQGGGATINFNIQANDAQGFDDLLIQRRAMITQFVSDAMAENGQRSRM